MKGLLIASATALSTLVAVPAMAQGVYVGPGGVGVGVGPGYYGHGYGRGYRGRDRFYQGRSAFVREGRRNYRRHY